MDANMGAKDRLIRVAVALVMMGLALGNLIGPWGWIGIIPLVSAALGWCPIYMLAGLSTRGV
ncbi:Permeases of the major facilitator superfamily [Paramagnetospirillum magnetotacticum MS-1]|uniref:Permeases of the major facilitator superfamily n=1 Tax=Paramagnetospirillum magnetotacticum MS-1 TaxID=272627 RepID=A0A0C2YGN2_PARME|nr:DUF2892 domain-containing protein [Paramagnetospirillum magnetotacticum]KIL98919.1 Permeases of the major facilitator superfamily [Paramagnetospirillum magnetotacticum MS-1]